MYVTTDLDAFWNEYNQRRKAYEIQLQERLVRAMDNKDAEDVAYTRGLQAGFRCINNRYSERNGIGLMVQDTSFHVNRDLSRDEREGLSANLTLIASAIQSMGLNYD